MLTLIILSNIFTCYVSGGDLQSNKLIICYVRSWAIYRKSFPFNVDHIDASLCTHLVYMLAGLNDSADDIVSKINHIDLADNHGNDMYRKMTGLKSKNPHLKVLLCLGGSGEASQKFSRLSMNNKKRRDFAKNAVTFLKKYNFDGLDLYWFKPETGDDETNFPLLLQEIKKDFSANNLLLSVIITGSNADIDSRFAVQEIVKHVDWLSINVYNYNTAGAKKFGIHAPLDSKDGYNIKSSVNHILSKGVPSNKLILRLGVHGYGYTNVDDAGNAGGAVRGLYDEDKGFLTIFEVCEYLDSGWTSKWDDQSSTPTAVKDRNIISYDDPKSLKIKVSFAVEKMALGVGFSSLDVDDFQGSCKLPVPGSGDHKYPLLRAVVSALNSNINSSQQNTDNSVNVSVVIHDF